MNPTN